MYLCYVTVQEFQVLFRSELNAVHPPGEVEAMLKWFLNEHLIGHGNPIHRHAFSVIDDAHLQQMRVDLMRLKSGEPFQYVMGQTFFFGMKLSVDNRVLIPRPETEEMLELITGQNNFDPATIVDVCTGSGCIALGLKKSFPEARVVALDVAFGALDLAEQNAGFLGLDVEWILQDVLQAEWANGLPRETHLVVSNPPYVLHSEGEGMHASVLEHEPSIALFVPNEDPLLFYRPIAQYGANTLVPGGQLWFEINPLKSVQVVDILVRNGFSAVDIVDDISGKARFVKAVR